MADKPLVEILKQIIERKTTSAKEVGNIKGTPVLVPIDDDLLNIRSVDWKVYSTKSMRLLSPDEIINLVATSPSSIAPVITGINGVTTHVTKQNGTTLFATILTLPSAIGIPITVTAPGCLIAVYSDETLVRRGSDRLSTSVNFNAGVTPLNIVVVGGVTNVVITLPKDINASISQYIPPVPQWRSPIPIETNYIDPKSGNTGNGLFWLNQTTVGGWGIYRATTTQYGDIKAFGKAQGMYFIRTTSVDTPAAPFEVLIDSGTYLGQCIEVTIDSGTQESRITIEANRLIEDAYTVFSGSGFYAITYAHLADMMRTDSSAEQSYVDVNVQAGTSYSYSLDAFATFDRSLRSPRSPIQTVVAGDATPPGSVTVQSVVQKAGILTTYYHTPADTDYLGTRLSFDNVSSGTVDSILVDYGLPDQDDSFTFAPVNSGEYYLTTFDKVGNEQYTYSGVGFVWDGSETVPGVNLPPRLLAKMLNSTEVTALGFNPYRWAVLELDADDDQTAHSSLSVDYRKPADGGWTTIPGTELPSGISLARSYTDNWLRARAYDGDLYSDELTFVVDYDTNPELSDLHGEYIVDSGAVFFTGAVDDDTKSLKWYVTAQFTGPTGSDPTPGSPATIDNLDTTKTFSFAVGLSDGQRKTIRVIPYSGLTGTGDAGLLAQLDYSRPPRTTYSTKERTVGGGVSRTNTAITFKVTPETALTYIKIAPIDWGDVTSAGVSSITDSTKSWTTDQYNDDYELWIVAGPGQGEKYTITATTGTTLSISPETFGTTPDSTSDYYVAEKYYLYVDSGAATSATASTLVDSTKTWATNQFQNQKVRMLGGAAGVPGQERQVASNTGTTLTLTADWDTNPSSGDPYEIFGPIVVAKSPDVDKRVYYYSDVPGIVTEEEKSIILDADDLPEFESFDLVEISTQVLRASVVGPDEDVKNWGLYVRKNSWPTATGLTASGTIDRIYGRYFGPTDQLEIEFAAGNGTWYAIAVPFDSFNNAGPRLSDAATITGSPPSPPPLLSNLTVTDETGYSSNATHRLAWDHNSVCENDANITVTVKAKRSDWGVWDTLVSGRRADYDAATESNSVSGEGSYDHTGINHLKEKFVTWYYEVWLYDTGVYQTKYSTYLSGFYTDIPAQ